MSRRFGGTARLLVLSLLLLAVSPVTAPFSTCDPLDLFGGNGAPTSPSGAHKSTQDPQAITCACPATGLPPVRSRSATAALPQRVNHVHRASHVPLRI